jgi:catalase
MAFNPVHGFPPLGITHARGAVYEASARNRGALGTDEARALLADGADRRAAARRN